MSRERISEDFKRFVLYMKREEQKLDARKRRLYNRYFKKSLFYWSSLIVRLLYIFLFGLVFIFYNKPKEFRYEKFVAFEKEYTSGSRYTTNDNCLVTNINTYHISKDFRNYDFLKTDDLLMVEYNVFNKPIHFKQEGWNIKYGIYKNYIYYYMLLFATCITFFFNDGYDAFTMKLLYVFYAVDIISIILFFIT